MQRESRAEPAAGSAAPSTPTHALILGSHGAGWSSVEALDPATGLPLWAYEPHRELNAVAGAPGVVFVALRASHLTDTRQPVSIVALCARDGSRLWWTNAGRIEPRLRWTRRLVGLRVAFGQFSLREALWAVREMRLGGDSTPLAADGDVLCVCAGSALFGFDARSGRLRWVAPALNGQTRHVLAVRNGRVLVTGNRDYVAGGPGLEARDARTGRVLWTYPASLPSARFARDDEHVYTLANLAPPRKPWRLAIATLSLADGTPQQLYRLPPRDSFDTLRLISDDGAAYFMRERELYAVQLADERELWRVAPFEDSTGDGGTTYLVLGLSPSTVASPVLAYGYVYRAPSHPDESLRVGALNPHTGNVLWRWNSQPGPRYGRGPLQLTAGHDSVYLSAVDGMHALSAADGHELWHMPAGFPSAREPVLVALDG